MTRWIIFFACADLVLAFPALDLRLAALFYHPDIGFPLAGQGWERVLYHSVPGVLGAVVLGISAARWRGWITGRTLALLLCLLVVVPGVIVNQLLKEHCGRPRPVQVTAFGGTQRFTPAFVCSAQGGGSFSSGHAAAAFYLVAVASTVAPGRLFWQALAWGYALLVGGARIVAGAHFFSDVLVSGLLIWVSLPVLRRWCRVHQ